MAGRGTRKPSRWGERCLRRLRSRMGTSLEELRAMEEDAAKHDRPCPLEFYELLGNRFLRAGQPILAFNAVEKGLAHGPKDPQLLKLKALALARVGATSSAQRILEELRRTRRASRDALGILARTYKDLWERTANRRLARKYLVRAHRLYSHAYQGARRNRQYDDAIYTGINAATTAFLLDRRSQARQIAQDVRAICLRFVDRQDYWTAATLGEAALLLRDPKEAWRWYRRATQIAGDNYGDLSTTRRSARLLLGAMGKNRAALDACFWIPKVIAFAGHMVDAEARPHPRFPPELTDAVRGRIAERLQRYAHKIGFSGAARGSDILFVEEMLKQGGEANIVLPFRKEHFVETSVDLEPRGTWKRRFARVMRNATSLTVASPDRVTGSSVGYEYSNRLLNGLALLRADSLHTDVVPLVVWNGKPGDGPGGTASHVAYWRGRGIEPKIIDIREVWAGLPARVRTRIQARTRRAATRAGAKRHLQKDTRQVVAILRADVKDSSRLTDEQMPVFVKRFLGMVSQLAARLPWKPMVANTWGDGLFMVFSRVEDAGRYALALRNRAAHTDWKRKGLPKTLSLRIALHAGPLHRAIDPVTRSPNFFGTHAVRVARIEPIAPAGHVWASQEFAALAAADGVRTFTCHYVGRHALDKTDGMYPLYHVHGLDGSAAAPRKARGAKPGVGG